MTLKYRLSRIEELIEGSKPEQFIIALECKDGLQIKACVDSTTGKRSQRVYDKVIACQTAKEVEETTNKEKTTVIVIKSRLDRRSEHEG